MTQRIFLIILAIACLTGCGESEAPKGRWEGFAESHDWLIAVRLEMQKGNMMRASALSAHIAGTDLPRRRDLEQELRQGMKDQWSAVPKTGVSFTGNTITRQKGYAPLFIHQPASNAMVFHFYAGGKLTEKVTLRPVETFAK